MNREKRLFSPLKNQSDCKGKISFHCKLSRALLDSVVLLLVVLYAKILTEKITV